MRLFGAIEQQEKRSPLLDYIQALSNSAASTVSGPVDLIAMGLRAAGVPVPQDAVLSSEWMARRGLTKEVPQGAARVLGETTGLVAPAAIAAKAPQIAAALNQAGRNLEAPRKLNPQTGAIVWHGSPHKFDKFDSSKIGTGEGAQAYGHGLYLAESPDVAKSYKTAGGTREQWAANELSKGTPEADVRGWIELWEGIDSKAAQAMVDRAKTMGVPDGALYKVDLPDSMIARMLDWDKPLSQQAGIVPRGLFNEVSSSRDNLRTLPADPTGQELIQAMQRHFRNTTGGAQALQRAGIPGIRYLDGGSRGAGQGTSNFVVFPGEESILTILERNGAPLR